MDKRTKAVLTVITVCLAIQIDPRTTVASEIDANTKEVTEARFFDPSEDTKYVGRLLSLSESYPLMKMMKLQLLQSQAYQEVVQVKVVHKQ